MNWPFGCTHLSSKAGKVLDHFLIISPWLLHLLFSVCQHNLFQGMLGLGIEGVNKADSQRMVSVLRCWSVTALFGQYPKSLIQDVQANSIQFNSDTLHLGCSGDIAWLISWIHNSPCNSWPTMAKGHRYLRSQSCGCAETDLGLTDNILHISDTNIWLLTVLLALNTCNIKQESSLFPGATPANPHILLGSIFKER